MSIDEYEDLLEHLKKTSWKYYVILAFFLIGTIWALFNYYIQLTSGLVVTGLRDTIFWGLYITNFVFFIGISHAGTLISAILRVTRAEWRRPITRMAEYITVMAISIGGLYPLIDVGRLDRAIIFLPLYGRLQSPILWDFVRIGTYLVGSITYLYLPLIPDLALARQKLKNVSKIKKFIYEKLSVNWAGNEHQKKLLEKAIGIMAILIIPIAVSVHTVVSWIFAMTFREGWRSTIFGPYFVVGAILSGIATIILIMAIFRKAYHLEKYITEKHFIYLAYMMVATDLFYIYLMLNEYLTTGYIWGINEARLLTSLYSGEFAIYFWAMVFTLVIPVFLIAFPQTRKVPIIVLSSILVNISMWLKRFVIIIPTLYSAPFPQTAFHVYIPSLPELSIALGGFFGFGLMLTIFSKLFPLISIWEVKEIEG